jgi:hypothetical protein
LIEEILTPFEETIGDELAGYKNHVYRMVHFCFAQQNLSDTEREKIMIAGCFHDIGIWTAGTFDYLPPSIEAANKYLVENDLSPWVPEITMMIDQHHKLNEYAGDPLTEIFRKGDLVDFFLGIFKCGLSGEYVEDVKHSFPNAGFHKNLVKLATRWISKHPLNPVPVLKW